LAVIVMTSVYFLFLKGGSNEDEKKEEKEKEKKKEKEKEKEKEKDSKKRKKRTKEVKKPAKEEEEETNEEANEEEQEQEQEVVVKAQVVESAPDVNNKKMCFYTNVYEMCNTKCGPGKRFRKQVEYTQDMNVSHHGIDPADLTLHVCEVDNDRESMPCEGTNCSDEFTYGKFIENNPGIPSSDQMTKYCEFIDANDACTDPNVRGTGSCRETCISKWR
jgi:hypothetical protein